MGSTLLDTSSIGPDTLLEDIGFPRTDVQRVGTDIIKNLNVADQYGPPVTTLGELLRLKQGGLWQRLDRNELAIKDVHSRLYELKLLPYLPWEKQPRNQVRTDPYPYLSPEARVSAVADAQAAQLALTRAGIRNVGDVVAKSYRELLAVPGIGEAYARNIALNLSKYGVWLGDVRLMAQHLRNAPLFGVKPDKVIDGPTEVMGHYLNSGAIYRFATDARATQFYEQAWNAVRQPPQVSWRDQHFLEKELAPYYEFAITRLGDDAAGHAIYVGDAALHVLRRMDISRAPLFPEAPISR